MGDFVLRKRRGGEFKKNQRFPQKGVFVDLDKSVFSHEKGTLFTWKSMQKGVFWKIGNAGGCQLFMGSAGPGRQA